MIDLYRHPRLAGLELWQGIAAHATLDQLRDDRPAYFAGLSRFLRELHAGRARAASGHDLSAAAGFKTLLLAGGEAAEAAAALTVPHQVAASGPFAARRGVEAIWAEYGWRRPVAIDLGQTSLKLYTPRGELRLARDAGQLPYGRHALAPSLGRARLRAFLAAALEAEGAAGADGILFGLPNAITAAGELEPCTYPGLAGPVEEILRGLVPRGVAAVAVNDAVLCARGFPAAPGRRTLVVTLGFGVGGAVWLP